MKKKLKDLQKGDLVQLFTRLMPVPDPFEVTLIEMRPEDKTISSLHLESPKGDKKLYSFMDKEKEIEMWTGYDVGSSINESICSHCGSVIK